VSSSRNKPGNSRSEQFKFVPSQPIKPPKPSRVSNKALTQISQLLGVQERMRKAEEETCYLWQLNCEWTPRVKASKEKSGVR